MLQEVKDKIENYKKLNNIYQYQLILDAASTFIRNLPEGVNNDEELELGIELFELLMSITMISSLHEFEYNYDLQNEILYKKLAVFRTCIPQTHSKLRNLTEMLVGMKAGKMDEITRTL